MQKLLQDKSRAPPFHLQIPVTEPLQWGNSGAATNIQDRKGLNKLEIGEARDRGGA